MYENNVADLMAKSGLSDKDVSTIAGITESTVRNYKKGRSLPNGKDLPMVCLALGATHPNQIWPKLWGVA
jgi:transcriptional regulator with XRE-family HTH domain